MSQFDWRDYSAVVSRYWERRHGVNSNCEVGEDVVLRAIELLEGSEDCCALMDALIDLLILGNAHEDEANEQLWWTSICSDVNSVKMRVSAYLESLRGKA